ncbi:MAG TPA: 5-formyltetrahydrofolate cyclo-ligase [bacterium]|nr:5-formyltetrahydrofolate cyclo-ligase [bacterium]
MTDRPAMFHNKDDARQYVWDTMQSQKIARFPFPPHHRIPNFAGAEEAANQLMRHPLVQSAGKIKVNPDAPQRYVRLKALEQGITVYMPTPRLRSGFTRLNPEKIPESQYSQAASLSKGQRFQEHVPLDQLPQMDLIVAGSVAVTNSGKRCGKGHGYSDLEYAILRELGHDAVPVATTVHRIQVVDDFPGDAHDVPLSVIVTPADTIDVETPPAPSGIDWELLSNEDVDAMPILKELFHSSRE